MKTLVATIALALLSACGTAQGNFAANQETKQQTRTPPPPAEQEPPYGSEMAMSGIYEVRFEHADFNGCWLDFTREASADFARLIPRDGPDSPRSAHRYRFEIMGRRTVPNGPGAPDSYGHLGGWNCQIEATRIISAEVIGPA